MQYRLHCYRNPFYSTPLVLILAGQVAACITLVVATVVMFKQNNALDIFWRKDKW